MPRGVYVKKRRPLAERFWSKVDVRGPDECWVWKGYRNPKGYGEINAGGRGRKLTATRISWELHNGPIPEGLSVCHRCDNPPCVNLSHLFLGTLADNNADCRGKGRAFIFPSARGETHGSSKLTAAQAVEIRSAAGIHREIAARFGISRSSVSMIKTGKNWSHTK